MARTLYQTLLGDTFDTLPQKIKAMHAHARIARGRANIQRGTSPIARLICAVARVPQSGNDVTIETHFEPIDGGERWTRRFNGEAFQTDMLIDSTAATPILTERFGPFHFRLRMDAHKEGVDLTPESVSLWGLPLPKGLCPRAVGLERVRAGKYYFTVKVRFPLAGDVLSYEGWIEPVH